ncbi:MAG TPA: tRNA adenosine(34) deaminase TadA, partial [Acidimicrobiales bacterium]|nr:tRNA adenosine(34) deaminase TadA [Acidimicrobiales bacterium]
KLRAPAALGLSDPARAAPAPSELAGISFAAYPLSPAGGDTVPGVNDLEAMDLALGEARSAGEEGDVPVGAVVVAGGKVVAAAGNRREATGDPTAHAEVLALRAAAVALGTWRLSDATLYVTLEPCPMCAGALVAARVARLVFACADPKAGACGSLYNLCVDPRLNHELEVVAGVRREEASQLLSGWFAERRARPAEGAAGTL